MITKFNTPPVSAPAATKGGNKTLLILLGVAVVGFLAWKFVIKPARDKKKNEEKKDGE